MRNDNRQDTRGDASRSKSIGVQQGDTAGFLKAHPEVNEIELAEGVLKVHLIRFSPIPITYSGWSFPTVWTGSSPIK